MDDDAIIDTDTVDDAITDPNYDDDAVIDTNYDDEPLTPRHGKILYLENPICHNGWHPSRNS